jgi:Bacterial Ig-like domain (group 3)
MKYLAILLSCASLAASLTVTRASTTPEPQAARLSHAHMNVGNIPLAFEPNRGQTDPRVEYLARGSGYTLFLSPASATFALLHGSNGRAGADGESSVIRMGVVGARNDAHMQALDRQAATSNYLRGRNAGASVTGVPTFARMQVAQIYPNIDLVYYGTDGRLEYDFVVAPSADPGQIRLSFSGATPKISTNGDLLLQQNGADPATAVRLLKPVVYQEVNGRRRAIEGKFLMASNSTVGFRVGSYDHSRALTIDPVLAYASYLGGSTQDSKPAGMALNAAGQIYLTGITFAADYPTTAGVLFAACPASMTGSKKCGASSMSSAFVSKIAADGQSLIYSTYLGGSGTGPGEGGPTQSAGGSGADYGVGVAVDANDEAWVLGGTNSNNFPITSDAFLTYCSPVAKDFNFTTNQSEGEFSGCANFNGGGEYLYGATSMFIVKLNPAGTAVLYGTFLGGSQGETPAAIALDKTGNVYVAATAANLNNLSFASGGQYNYPTTSGAFQKQGLATGNSAVVSELSADGHTLIYSTFFSAPTFNTFGTALVVSSGKIFLGGTTLDPHLPTTAGALSTTCPSNPDECQQNGFVAEFDPSKSGAASLVFATYMNGKHVSTSGIQETNTTVSALAADSTGNVYVGGSDQYVDFPTTAGSLQPTCFTSGRDFCETGFVTKLSPAGALVWSTFYGSPSGASGTFGIAAMALDSANNVYIANNSAGAGDLPTKNNLFGFAGGSMVLAELSSDGAQVLFGTFYGTASNVFPTAIALDANNNIFFTGYTAATDLALVKPLQSSAAGGFNEGFFAKISTQKLTSTTALAVTPTTAALGASVMMTATLTGQSGQAVPTGAVGFNNGTTVLGTATLASTGVATFTSSTLAAGTYSVVAKYAGDITYAASASSATSLTITAAPPAAPTVTIAVGPNSIVVGKSSTLTWSSANASVCTASGAWTGTQATSGSAMETPTAAGTATYTLTCTGAGGSANASASLAVTAATPAPTVTISASPVSITVGQTSTLTWSSTNATACAASGSWSGAEAVSGTATETPSAAGTATYTLTCTGTGGSGNASAAVTATAASAPVTPPSSGHSGGGALDWLTISGLLSLTLFGALRRRSI